VLAERIVLEPKMTGFLPVKTTPGPRGEQQATPKPLNTSGDFTGLTGTDGFVELPAGREELAAGTAVRFWAWG
jgi:molybdopterin molybdotransferase